VQSAELENGEGRCSALGLPIGLQITGAPFAEFTVLALAHGYERETACTRGILRHSEQLCH
jgi:Asp-tRNA(Asn)/Glu-tRNA(Gln) amidotransferase A subunit family amidase